MTQTNPFATQQQAKPNQPADEFELMRRRLKLRGGVRGEEAQRGVSRQQAALGNLPSGAAIKLQQQAAQQAEAQTGRELTDVNILEAQTRRAERESELQRAFGREGFRSQEAIAREQIAGQRGLQELIGQQQAAQQQVIGEQAMSQQQLIGEQELNAIKARGASDLEIAQLRGADQKEIANLQIQSSEKMQLLTERGMDERLAKTLSENSRMFDIEQRLRQRGFDLQEELFKDAQNTQDEQMKMDKFATVINSIDLLQSLDFSSNEIGNILNNLDVGLSEDVMQALTTSEVTRIQRIERRQDRENNSELGFDPADQGGNGGGGGQASFM